MALQEFGGKRAVGFRAAAVRVVLQDAFAKTRRLAQAHGPRDDGLVNALSEMFAHLGDDLSC